VYLIVLMRLDRGIHVTGPSQALVVGGAVLVLFTAALVTVLGLSLAVLVMGVIVAALVTTTVALAGKDAPAQPLPARDPG
jgi:hypothetical protein